MATQRDSIAEQGSIQSVSTNVDDQGFILNEPRCPDAHGQVSVGTVSGQGVVAVSWSLADRTPASARPLRSGATPYEAQLELFSEPAGARFLPTGVVHSGPTSGPGADSLAHLQLLHMARRFCGGPYVPGMRRDGLCKKVTPAGGLSTLERPSCWLQSTRVRKVGQSLDSMATLAE